MRPRATSLSLCSGDLDAVYAQQAVARADARIGRAAVGGDGLHGQSGRRQVPYQTGAVDFRFLRLGGREQRDVDEFAQAVHCQHQCAVPHFVGEQFQPIHIGDRQGVDGHQQVARLDARFVRPVSGPHLPHEQPGAAREVFLFGRGERFDAYPIASQQPTLQRSGVPQQLRDAVNRNRGKRSSHGVMTAIRFLSRSNSPPPVISRVQAMFVSTSSTVRAPQRTGAVPK